ncbi:MAG: hypothetical protein ABI813_08020 [Bacteroidota bacterium]
MKKIFLTATILTASRLVMACPLCEKQQPALLRGITHGTGPGSRWDYLIVYTAVAVVLFTLYFSVKWLLHPGEKEANHIKRLILNNE